MGSECGLGGYLVMMLTALEQLVILVAGIVFTTVTSFVAWLIDKFHK